MDSDRPEPIRVTPIPPESVPASSSEVPPPTGNIPPPPPPNVPPPVNPPPPPPYAPPSGAPAPHYKPSGSDKVWAILSHLSYLVGIAFFILPLVVYLAMKDESEYAASNAKEALNFHISLAIYALCAGLLALTIIAIPLVVFLAVCMGIAGFVLAIVAAIKAADGVVYRYPLTIRLIS